MARRLFTKRAADGIAECEHALGLDRNLAAAHSIIGRGKIYIGRAEETEAHVGEALRLSPRALRHMKWFPVPISGRRPSSPALESMIKRG